MTSVSPLILLARLGRLERSTYGLEVRCSIQLSYRRALGIYSFSRRVWQPFVKSPGSFRESSNIKPAQRRPVPPRHFPAYISFITLRSMVPYHRFASLLTEWTVTPIQPVGNGHLYFLRPPGPDLTDFFYFAFSVKNRYLS